MKSTFKYLLLLYICLLCLTCKKKTTINVQLFNPLLNEYVSNATLALIESHQGGLLNDNASCKEIATAITNNNGECNFDKEKLRRSSNYDYYCVVKESWGSEQSYPCGGKSSGFINKGKTQDFLVIDDGVDGYFKIQYNNLFSTAQVGDSLIVIPRRLVFPNPKGGTVGGGGVGGGAIFAYTSNSYSPVVTQNTPEKISGVIVINIRKRKMGVVSVFEDTVKVYPNRSTIAQVYW